MFEYTEEEKASMIKKFFESEESLSLIRIPKKQKHQYLCLLWIVSRFDKQKKYREYQVNEILKDIYSDYVLIRRMLIDDRLLERTVDGSLYWVSKNRG